MSAPTHRRTKPGPKPFDIREHLHDRVPAFTTEGDDERIDCIFDSGLIERLFRTRLEEIPSFFFEHMWSSRASTRFQSLIMYRNTIYEVITNDPDTGDITYVIRGAMTKRFAKEFAIYALELTYSIAKYSVPVRIPDRLPEANALLEKLCTTIDGMTLRDAIKRSGSYTKHTFAGRHKLDDTLYMLSDVMTRYFPTCFTL
jgi:hypothetical protein